MTPQASERFTRLDGEAFARLVARTWRAYGRTVVATDPTDLLGGDPTPPIEGAAVLSPPSPERRVVLTHPGEERLAATELLDALAPVDSPEALRVVSAAGFEPGALSVGDAYGVALVGPETLARLREHEPDRATP